MKKLLIFGIWLVLGYASTASIASAEKSEVVLVKQFSLASVPLVVMETHGLLEKHAKIAGLEDLTVQWRTLSGSDATNAALISGSVDVAVSGVPGFLILWDKTRGTSQEVKAIAPLGAVPFELITRNPNVKSLSDFTAEDRITVPGVRVSINAVALAKAAELEFGEGKYAQLDERTINMGQPDATAGMLSGVSGFSTVFSAPPYQYQLLQQPGMRKILSSFDVFGPHTGGIALGTAAFRKENPKIFGAIVSALQEAEEMIQKDPKAAIQDWINASKSTVSFEVASQILDNPGTSWDLAPLNVMKIAEFVAKIGLISSPPENLEELFFPEFIEGRSGS